MSTLRTVQQFTAAFTNVGTMIVRKKLLHRDMKYFSSVVSKTPRDKLSAYLDTARTLCSVNEDVPIIALKLQEIDMENKMKQAEAFYQKSLSFLTQRF
jgi:hypothetical protein